MYLSVGSTGLTKISNQPPTVRLVSRYISERNISRYNPTSTALEGRILNIDTSIIIGGNDDSTLYHQTPIEQPDAVLR
jgi:hypothetical protein